jgi:hypothetical protein
LAAGSIAFARCFAEVFLELALLTLVIVSVSRWLFLARDVGPFSGKFRVQLQPFLEAVFCVGQNGFRRAFRLTHATVDALVGIDDEHIFALVETIDGANFHAVGVFASDAVIGDNICHGVAFKQKN